MHDMSKYTILVVTSLTTTFLLVVTIVTIVFVSIGMAGSVPWINLRLVTSFDNVINSLCLLLQFDFASNIYKRVCIKCHGYCEDRYTKRTNAQNNHQLERLPTGDLGFKVNQGSNSVDVNNDNDNNSGLNPMNAMNLNGGSDGTKSISLVAQKSAETLRA